MNHSIDNEKYCTAMLGTLKFYVSSYEVSRDSRYSFQNNSKRGLYFTDNGPYPAYMKINGYFLKSECDSPCVTLNELMDNDFLFFFALENIYFNAAKLKSYSVLTDIKSEIIKCEIVLCCNSYISKKEVS